MEWKSMVNHVKTSMKEAQTVRTKNILTSTKAGLLY